MSLFIAQNFMTSTYQFASVQTHIISISVMDTGIGFAAATTSIEGANCTAVTYARTQTGPTAIRLERLVQDTGFTSPQRTVIFGVPSGTIMPNGIDVSVVAGQAFRVGATGSPLANNIALIYDTGDCHGSGHWVDKEGGGTTSFPPDVILYHELAHCFHFATGVATSEPLAETDENDMRDVRGLPHRNTASHNGGCGGGPTSCCIVASLATGSSYSEEIKRFRNIREHTLRQSAVGDDFFNEFFYRYYGFSPEVTRLIGHQPNLRPLIKRGFVMPLLAGVEMLIFYADNRGARLAEFLRLQAARDDLTEIYQERFLNELSGYLKIARNVDDKAISLALNDKGNEYSGFEKLLQHVNKKTIEDEYIDWSLVAVIELWVESALLLYSGKSDAEIDFETYEKIINWIALMPISKVWDEFSRLETELELRSLEQFIFDPKAKDVFSKRLLAKHPRYRETVLAWAKGQRR